MVSPQLPMRTNQDQPPALSPQAGPGNAVGVSIKLVVPDPALVEAYKITTLAGTAQFRQTGHRSLFPTTVKRA